MMRSDKKIVNKEKHANDSTAVVEGKDKDKLKELLQNLIKKRQSEVDSKQEKRRTDLSKDDLNKLLEENQEEIRRKKQELKDLQQELVHEIVKSVKVMMMSLFFSSL